MAQPIWKTVRHTSLWMLTLVVLASLTTPAVATDRTECSTTALTAVEVPAGTGTASDPYLIANLGNLRWISEGGAGSFDGKYLRQTADIDASDTVNWNACAGYQPTDNYRGIYDGGGFTISNLYINRPTESHVALFGEPQWGGSVYNLSVLDADVTGGDRTGIVFGTCNNGCWMQNVHTSGTVSGTTRVGGVAGFMQNNWGRDLAPSRFLSSEATVTCTGSSCGGIYGAADGSGIFLSDTRFSGSVTGPSKIGGITGENGSITRALSVGTVTSTAGSYGGITGSTNDPTAITAALYLLPSVSGTGTMNLSGNGSSAVALQDEASYAGWGINEASSGWTMNTQSPAFPAMLVDYTLPVVKNTETSVPGLWDDLVTYPNGTNGLELAATLVLEGATPIVDRAICYRALPDGVETCSGITEAAFELAMGGLTPNTSYELRAAASNASGTAYSGTIIRTTGNPPVGIIPAPPTTGTGTSTDPYIITTAANLRWMSEVLVNISGKYFKQDGDIDLTGNASWDGGQGFTPIKEFRDGVYDGNGFAISNLYINRPTMDEVGLVGYPTWNGVFKNLFVLNAQVTGRNEVGILYGFCNNNCWVEKVYTTGTVTGNDKVGGVIGAYRPLWLETGISFAGSDADVVCSGTGCGGVVGTLAGGDIIEDAFFTGTVSGTGNLMGGIFGGNWGDNGVVTRAYSAGTVTAQGSAQFGGVVGNTGAVNITSSYYLDGSATTTGNQTAIRPELARTQSQLQTAATFAGWDINGASGWLQDPATNNGYPYFAIEATIEVSPAEAPPGTGTAEDPYVLTTAAHLHWFSDQYANSFGGKHIHLGADIDAFESKAWNDGAGFEPHNSFQGTFDGKGYTIYDLYIYRPVDYESALFKSAPGALIQNIIFEDVNIRGVSRVATVVSDCYSNCTLRNITVSGTITNMNTSGGQTGAHVGQFRVESDNINYRSFGLVSHANITCENGPCGGIAGSLNATGLSHSYSTGTITSKGGYVGGIAGEMVGNLGIARGLFQSYSRATVVGTGNVATAGLIGRSSSATYGDDQNSRVVASFYDETIPPSGSTNITHTEVARPTAFLTDVAGLQALGWDIGYANSVWKIDPQINAGYPYIDTDAAQAATMPAISNQVVDASGATEITASATVSHGTQTLISKGLCLASTNQVVGTCGTLDVTSGPTALSVVATALTPIEVYFARTYVETTLGRTYGDPVAVRTWTPSPPAGQTIATAPTVGDGSQGDPWQISTLAELKWISEADQSFEGVHFVQTADIDASETAQWNTVGDHTYGYIPLGRREKPFRGHYNGGDHKITNLTINALADDAAFVGAMQAASLTALRIVNANVTATSSGFEHAIAVGWAHTSSVTSISTSGTLNSTNAENGGGVVGHLWSTTGHSLSSSATITCVNNNNGCGGVLGRTAGGSSLYDAYFTGAITGKSRTGGLVGFSGQGVPRYSYSTGSVTVTNDVAGGVSGHFWLASSSGDAFYDKDVVTPVSLSNQGILDAADGRTTAQLTSRDYLISQGWDFVGETANGTNDRWSIDPNLNGGYPFLVTQPGVVPIPASITAGTLTADGPTGLTMTATINSSGSEPITESAICVVDAGINPAPAPSCVSATIDGTTITGSASGLIPGGNYAVYITATSDVSTVQTSALSIQLALSTVLVADDVHIEDYVLRVPIEIADLGSFGVTGVEFTLGVHTDVATFVSITPGSALLDENEVLDNGTMFITTPAENGHYVAVASASPITGSDDVIAYVNLQPVDVGTTTFSLTDTWADNTAGAFDLDVASVFTMYADYGDIDRNGMIRAFDAALVLQDVVGLTTFGLSKRIAANVDGSRDGTDHVVSSIDAAMILQRLVNLIPCFPVESSCSPGPNKAAEGATQLAVSAGAAVRSGTDLTLPITIEVLRGTLSSLDLRTAGLQGAEILSVEGIPSGWLSAVGPKGAALAGAEGLEGSLELSVVIRAPMGRDAGMTDELRLEVSPNGEAGAAAQARVEELPDALAITGIYPSPFDTRADVVVTLPSAAELEVTVYDLLGRRVDQLAAGAFEAGTHRFAMQGDRLPAGVYIVRLVSGGSVHTKQVVHL